MQNKEWQYYYRFDEKNAIWLRSSETEFNYSDGDDVENHLREILNNVDDVRTISDDLLKYQTDWATTYHLSSKRANLLRPIEKRLRDACVLELGCGCGGVTRYLGETAREVFSVEGSARRASLAALRCRGLNNVNIISDYIQDIPFKKETFDVVTLIGVLEYARVYGGPGGEVKLLQQARSYLKPDGLLVLAMENQLGLKYFAGIPEDHTGGSWFGINNAYSDTSVVTFSRQELEELLSQAGFEHVSQYVTVPDYKLTETVILPLGLDAPRQEFNRSELMRKCQRPYEDLPLFSLYQTWDVVDRAGLFRDMADSLCFIASPQKGINDIFPENVLALHYGALQRRIRAKEVSFYREPQGIIVQRKFLNVDDATKNEVMQNKRHHLDSEKYFPNETLYHRIAGVMNRPDWSEDDLAICIHPWVNWLKSQCNSEGFLPPEYIDATPFNILMKTSGEVLYFDKEWSCGDNKVSLCCVAIRGMFLSLYDIMPFSRKEDENEYILSLCLRVLKLVGLEIESYDLSEFFEKLGELSEYAGLGGIEAVNVKRASFQKRHSYSSFQQYILSLSLARQELVVAMEQKQSAEAQLSEQKRLVERLNSEVELIRSSRSWKSTAPLRYVVKRGRQSMSLCKKTVRYCQRHGLGKTLFRLRQEVKGRLRSKRAVTLNETSNFLTAFRSQAQKNYYSPLVSVIVPNYNHSLFLKQRLDSIYSQTYKNIEIILLDDSSTDDSVCILEEYRKKNPLNTRLYVNKENSGSPFRQWAKGIFLAQGELVFIAESDDFCASNFLETLVPFFNNDLVSLAYSDLHFLRDGETITTLSDYMRELSPDWGADFIYASHMYVETYLSVKNTIPNASAVLFRKKNYNPILDDDNWLSLRLCGDWVFYLSQIKSGFVAFTNKTQSYYRIHDAGTSVNTQKRLKYYIEHEKVAKYMAENYRLDSSKFKTMRSRLDEFRKTTLNDLDEKSFNEAFRVDEIISAKKKRKCNIVIASFGFTAGGGETFPIMMANGFHGRGHAVTFLNFDYVPRESDVRALLDKDIPVIHLSECNFSLAEIVNSLGADIIHSHHSSIDFAISREKKFMPMCKHVVSLHGMYEAIDQVDRDYTLSHEINTVDLWIYTAQKNLRPMEPYMSHLTNKLFHVPNALPNFPINPLSRSDFGLLPDDFVLCLVSRGIAEKGWQEAIDAVILANDKSSRKIHLLLIGEGEMYDKFVGQTVPNVHFLGFRKNIRDFFAMSDMGFLPTRFPGESFPLVVIDCLLSGRPVLATSIGEIPYQLSVNDNDNDNDCIAGELVPLDGGSIPISFLAERIVAIANTPSLYQKLSLRVPDAAKKFDFDVMLDTYCHYYDEITKE